MRTLLATIVDGEADWADFLWLVAVVVFLVYAALEGMARNVPAAILGFGLACSAGGWLLL